MMEYKEDNRPWYKVHTIPIALGMSIIANSVIGVWTVSKFDSKVTDHENRIEHLEVKVETINTQNIVLGRIEADVKILLHVNGLGDK